MIEEAAGTRMYESKKMSAQKTIVKKEAKLQDIQTVSLPPSVLTLSSECHTSISEAAHLSSKLLVDMLLVTYM